MTREINKFNFAQANSSAVSMHVKIFKKTSLNRFCQINTITSNFYRIYMFTNTHDIRDDRVVRWCCVNFQCRSILLIWIRVGQGPTTLAVGADRGCLDSFTLVYYFCSLSPPLWETARYRLKYCLKGPLSQNTTNQPTSRYTLKRIKNAAS